MEGIEEIPRRRNYFTDDDSGEAGVLWEQFITALQVWTWMRDSNTATTVSEAAEEFQVTPEVVRAAVKECAWMFLEGPDDDPTKQHIEHDGE